MRKAISLFLAASVLAFATTAMAAPTQSGSVTGTPGVRNSVTTFGNAANAASMPCFRPGDTINFTLGNLTDGELTLITYKDGSAGSLSDSNVQYINQYTISGSTTQAVNYTIRTQDSGVYVIKANDASGTVATFYYKIGNAAMYTVNGNGEGSGSFGAENASGSPYILHYDAPSGTYSIGFIGKAVIDSGSVSLADIGAHPGFAITHGGTTKNYGFGLGSNSGNAVSDLSSYEISGSYSYIYGITVKGITSGQQTGWTAQAVLDTANAQ